MTEFPNQNEGRHSLATLKEIKDVLGDMDDSKITAIMDLRPTIADVENASMWIGGDLDVFGVGRPLKDVPDRIVSILAADEDDDPSHAC